MSLPIVEGDHASTNSPELHRGCWVECVERRRSHSEVGDVLEIVATRYARKKLALVKLEPVVGQLNVVAHGATNEEIRNEGNPQ